MAISPELHQFNYEHQETLSVPAEYRFSLEGHKLVDPLTNRGHVTNVYEVAPISDEADILPCKTYDILVEDPFVAADPHGYSLINTFANNLERQILADGFDLHNSAHRTEAVSRDQQNHFTKTWLSDEKLASIQVWRDLVPSAEALGYLTNPWVDSIVSNRDGETARLTPEAAAHMRFVDDAIGIRDRGTAFEYLGVDHLTGLEEGSDIKWLSLASGTAEPSIMAAKRAYESSRVNVNLTVADIDPKSLRYVRRNAQLADFKGKINTVLHNILDEKLAQTLEETTGHESQYEVVEAMGFQEYLPQEGDELAACKGSFLPQASEFTARAYAMVKPGGILMSGNMIYNRTQRDFVFGVVDWPIINARSEKSILRVYKEAGILDDPNANLEMFRIKDATSGTHIYNIIKVTKKA